VQVALDTMRKVEAQMYMKKYETLSAVGLWQSLERRA
jgi:preprotein translocase subunit SecY